MKNLLLVLLVFAGLQIANAQNANQVMLEQTHPEIAKEKRVTKLAKLDKFHTAVGYKSKQGTLKEDLVYNKDGAYSIIGSFKEIPSVDMPKNIIESFKRNYKTKANRYFIVTPAAGAVNYFAIETGKTRIYYSKMGHQMQPTQ